MNQKHNTSTTCVTKKSKTTPNEPARLRIEQVDHHLMIPPELLVQRTYNPQVPLVRRQMERVGVAVA